MITFVGGPADSRKAIVHKVHDFIAVVLDKSLSVYARSGEIVRRLDWRTDEKSGKRVAHPQFTGKYKVFVKQPDQADDIFRWFKENGITDWIIVNLDPFDSPIA